MFFFICIGQNNYHEKIIYQLIIFFSASTINIPLQLIQIYFDTAAYDEIEKDVKVTLEAQLGLIGGTMGLLTGFSILSGVEICYFGMKFFMSLRKSTMSLKTVKKVNNIANWK